MYDLRVLLIEVTQKCNAKCDQCGSRCDIHSEELLTKTEILNALKDIKENIGTNVMLNITGGEPLLRKDLFEIMSEATDMGFDWGMVTNGSLITDKIIKQMKDSGLKTITISIDGMKETHERLRHLPNSFERIINSLQRLKNEDFLDHIQVTFTSNKQNYKEIIPLYHLLNNIGIDSLRTSFIDPIGRATEYKELMLNKEEMNWICDFVNEQNKKKQMPIIWGCCHYLDDKIQNRKFDCFAGIYSASILYNGDIFVCPNVPREKHLIQGNIKTDSFSKVWNEKFEYFRNKPTCNHCEGCRHLKECNGDSLHTFDFENNKPKFCYKDIFEQKDENYIKYIQSKYKNYEITEVPSTEDTVNVYIEPEAYQDIKQYFHIGHKHPLSMFEQQMGLIGFKVDDGYVVKYVFPSIINTINNELATFQKDTIKQVKKTTKIIRKNFNHSSDKDDYIGDGLKFLGFIHSHPTQDELQYSVGDEYIHTKLASKNKDYIGILVNPSLDIIGAYYGETIKQANLLIIEKD